MTSVTRERLLNRNFVLLWQGQLVSQLGNQAFLVATMSWLLETRGSPLLMGLLLMASTLPAVIVGPVAGAVADRYPRRALIVGSDFVRGLGHLALGTAMAVSVSADGIVAALLAWAVVSGVVGAVLMPALTAAIPDVVPQNRLASANSVLHMSSQAATLVGQAVGGVALIWIGVPGLILFDGATFLLSALAAAFARVPAHQRHGVGRLHATARAYLDDVRTGIAWLRARPPLRTLVLAFCAVNFLFTPVFVLLPVYVKDILRQGPEWYGFLLAAAGAGAIAGAAVTPVAVRRRGDLRWCLLGIGGATAALAATRSALLATALLFALGSCSGILNVRVMTTLQSAVPGDLRGRVVAVTVALAGAAVPAGLGLGGLLGDVARPALAWLVAACGSAIVVAALWLPGAGSGGLDAKAESKN
jgi:MFS transporter, DHA3 family, macrolide efflux protein